MIYPPSSSEIAAMIFDLQYSPPYFMCAFEAASFPAATRQQRRISNSAPHSQRQATANENMKQTPSFPGGIVVRVRICEIRRDTSNAATNHLRRVVSSSTYTSFSYRISNCYQVLHSLSSPVERDLLRLYIMCVMAIWIPDNERRQRVRPLRRCGCGRSLGH